MTGPERIYHLVPAEHYRSIPRDQPYVPEAFDADGFIHCTDGIQHTMDVGNRYYRDDRRMYVLLTIDPAKVSAEIRNDDSEKRYPHIYGALNRDAIVTIAAVLRGPDGAFLRPNGASQGEG